jgi:hypothetical protein
MSGPGEAKGPERGPNISRAPLDVSKVRCYRCDRLGHFVRNCPELPKRGPDGPRGNNGLNGGALDQQAGTQ